MSVDEMIKEKNTKSKKTAKVLFNSDSQIQDITNERFKMPTDSSGM